MNNLPKVAVVILNWNGLNYLQQFLPSVLSSTWPNFEVIVGDNASTDNSVAFLQQNYSGRVKVIINDQNYGFTGGYNRVLEQVEADYYILLNSDIEVTPNWIEPVITLLDSDDLMAAAAPKIRSYNQKNFFEHAGAAGGYLDRLGYPFCRGRMFYEIEEDKGQYDQSDEVFWATGAALFIKSKYWKISGGFDERFFAHMEEIDLCWRLKNRGLKVMYCAQSVVYHVGGGTLNVENPFKTYLNFRNNLLLLQNNLPTGRAVRVITLRFWMDLLALFRFLNEGKRKDAWAVSKAHQSFVWSLFKRSGKSVKSQVLTKTGKTTSSSHVKTHTSNLKGLYKNSIVVDFFARKKTHFTDLNQKDFY